MPSTWLAQADVSCIQNKAQAFCSYTSKPDPRKGGHLVVVLTTARPIAVVLKRVSADTSLSTSLDGYRQAGYSVSVISPIFGQLVRFSFPAGFGPKFEQTNGDHYIREVVLQGQTVDNWTQMLTVTGERNLALKSVTPRMFAESIAGGFRRACPESFSAKTLGDGKISGFDSYIAVVSCGTSPTTQGTTSETALLIVVRGQSDFYTLQWAERAEKSATPVDIDTKKWDERFHQLGPVKLCPIIAGENAPYPSCSN